MKINDDKHSLNIRLWDGSHPSMEVDCLDYDNPARACYSEGLNEENCMVKFASTELGWESLRLVNRPEGLLLRVNLPAGYEAFGYGVDDFEDWIVIEG